MTYMIWYTVLVCLTQAPLFTLEMLQFNVWGRSQMTKRYVRQPCCTHINNYSSSQTLFRSFWLTTDLIDGRLLYQTRCVRGKDSMCGHDKDFISSSLLQCLSCCQKTVHIVDNIILQTAKNIIPYFKILNVGELTRQNKHQQKEYLNSHHNDSNPTTHVSHYCYWGLFFGDKYYCNKITRSTLEISTI